jgi:hypothetical protein|tara:strand:- start:54017 stop:54409 length:393 start_codon:yes stop_codon:yes gene_type:complete
MMFVKLIVLILALGSTGVGVLSVRQARLETSNEMTQSRLRSRELTQRSMELRAQIAERITPDQIRAMLGEQLDQSMVNQTHRRIELLDPRDPEPAIATEDESVDHEQEPEHPNFWTLDDGTRVIVIDPEN